MLLSFRHITVQRLLGTQDMESSRDTEGRSNPPKVYPAATDASCWTVEPPDNANADVNEPRTFTGRAALLQALEYAHRTYGNAQYLSR